MSAENFRDGGTHSPPFIRGRQAMIFRQLFDPGSSSYTYLLGCPHTLEAILVDPVAEMIERDLAILRDLGLRLSCTVETHVHADHLTSAWALRERTGCQVACPAADGVPCADMQVQEGRAFRIGCLTLLPLHTPGHTAGHHCYLLHRSGSPMIFTGDALLIGGCGRTDLQGGDAATLYRSIHEKLFTLPDDTLVYPAHDYHGRQFSTVAQERAGNSRLGEGRSVTEFIAIMAHLDLPYPKKIDIAVPRNRCCGGCAACLGAPRVRSCR